MKTLFWNARGLEGSRAIRVLHSLMREIHPDVVFLMETVCDHVVMEGIRIKLGFDAKLVVNCDGNSGGLCLFWKLTMDVSLLSYSRFHIDTIVTSSQNKKWRLTCFYGLPNSSQKIHGWTLL